jgi:hypothetical protein
LNIFTTEWLPLLQAAERQADSQRTRALGVEAELAELQSVHRSLEADTRRRLGAAKDREEALLERANSALPLKAPHFSDSFQINKSQFIPFPDPEPECIIIII